MFCPKCGIDERNPNQFCRACGTNLRPVINLIERPDNITQSAVSAREEIGRAVAEKIRTANTAVDLKIVVEDVLPEIEKFLESPEEKRLRRARVGTIIALIGLGAAAGMLGVWLFLPEQKEEFLILSGLGLVTFFIGLAFVVNGYFLTVPETSVDDHSDDAARQRALDSRPMGELPPTEPSVFISSTEHTTLNLTDKVPATNPKQ